MRAIYLVHDLNDPAVERRVSMLESAGVQVVLAGFWRGAVPPRAVAGAAVVPLDRTFDARLLHRAVASVKNAVRARSLVAKLGDADVLMARNLEMLVIAAAAKRHMPSRPAIVYEVLDIHRLMLSRGAMGRGLRALERTLMRRAALLITSSPAFLREYFEPLQFRKRRLRHLLIENKELACRAGQRIVTPVEAGPPWRIGWLGMLRCRRSVEILCGLAKRRPDLVQIRINGRPTREVSEDLQRWLRQAPNARFGGPYRREDIASLYRNVHFNWAIDYFEAGANSRLLLPNRIYEGGSHDVVPIALRGTETANWLKALGLGVMFDDPARELESFFDNLTPENYAAMKRASESIPRSAFVAGRTDCQTLGNELLAAAARRKSARLQGKRSLRALSSH